MIRNPKSAVRIQVPDQPAPDSPPPRRPIVRPWALLGPILLLLLCLPILRPLRHPAELPQEEFKLVEMVKQNLTGDLYVSNTPPISLQSLTEPSPMFALVLTAPAWLMQKLGFDFENNATFMAYMLIALGVTLPVALSAGLIYRMGRLFELSRPKRAILGIVCVTASGLISYATTLSAHALAATLLIAAAASVMQTLRAPRAATAMIWTILSGFFAMLAATLDAAALPVSFLMPIVFLAWRVNWGFRILAVGLFIAGSIAPVFLHRSLHGRPTSGPLAELAAQPQLKEWDDIRGEWDVSVSHWLGFHIERLSVFTVGAHGLFSHFPLLILGAIGVLMLMHRNWPESIKWLAAATLLASIVAVVAIVLSRIEYEQAAFATRWFIAFSPLLLFWCGAWMRREHRKSSWTAATFAAAFSIAVAYLGAIRPMPPGGYDGFTAASALQRIVHSPTNVARQ